MQMIRVPVTEEEFIVTFILELARQHAQVDSVRAIADALRAERGIGRAEVLDYLARFAEEIKAVEPALQPHDSIPPESARTAAMCA